MDDKAIVDGIYRRDEYMLGEADKKFRRLMFSVAYNIVGNTGDADEVANDALLDIWNSIPPQRPENLATYSVAIARRRAIDRLEYNRAAKRNATVVSLDEISDMIADGSPISDGKLTELIDVFLGGLSKTDRRVFLQRYYLCQPVGDISESLNISFGTVCSKLQRIRGKLKKFLGKNGICV